MTLLPKILIKNGMIYDPAQEWRGEKRDLYLSDSKISKPFSDPEITIDAAGKSVMAGGIEPFCHLAIPGQQIFRMNNDFPSPEEIGTAYARCGYVHVHQPIMTLLTANAVWRSLSQIPYLDKSAWVTIDLRDMGKYFKSNNYDEFIAQAKVLIKLTGAIGLFLPFPYLKHKQRHYMQKNISQKKAFEFISAIDDTGILPINLWGQPGLFDADISKPGNLHICDPGSVLNSEEAVIKMQNFLNAGGSANIRLNDGKKGLAVLSDMEPVPGSISLDLGLNHSLRVSQEQTPIDKDESISTWSLLKDMQPEWRISISAPDPCGESITRQPEIASWLLTQESRPDTLKDLLNDFTINLYEFARMTRLEPARSLGLDDLGNLKNGSRATLAIYDINSESSPSEYQNAFTDCSVLIKDGVIVRNNGEFTGDKPPARPITSNIEADPEAFAKSDLLQRPTIRWENLAVDL